MRKAGFLFFVIVWLVAVPAPALAAPIELPDRAPVPEAAADRNGLPDQPDDIPKPEAKPSSRADKARQLPKSEYQAELPAGPDERAVADGDNAMPPAETVCRERLKQLGVSFEERLPQREPAGCAIPHPIAVTTLGSGIGLAPEALLNCAMAEASARFMRDVASPAADRHLGAKLESVGHASAYVCRPRNGSSKLSEHAFGNALDIASFKLSDGTTVEVGPALAAKPAAFVAEIRKAACGPFKTVLGPGSDADHALHLHFDLQPRRNGGTFCQ